MSFNIVFLNRSFYPDITATGGLLSELCQDLVNRYGLSVTVIAGNPLITGGAFKGKGNRFSLMERQNWQGVEVLRVNSSSFSTASFLKRVLNYLTYFFLAFLASFRIKRPKLVVALTDPPIIGFVGLWIAMRFAVPFVISVRDLFPEAAGELCGKNNPISFLLEHMNRFLLKRADRVVALGKLMRDNLIKGKKVPAEKISIIPDWADTDNIRPVSKDNLFSKAQNISDKFIVMYAGNIGVSSGLTVLIEAANLVRENKNILFLFIGEGIMKNKLINLARSYDLENTRFLPFQPRDQLSQVFSSADLFVVALKKDLSGYSLPSKIYAIMASGRPYIASVGQESEISQITAEYNSGIVVPPENSRALAEKILLLYSDTETRLKLSENARKASDFFSRSKQVDNYYRIFRQL